MAGGRSKIGAASRRTYLETIPGHEPFNRIHHQLDGHTPTLEWRTHGTSCESLRVMNRERRRPFVEAALRGRASRVSQEGTELPSCPFCANKTMPEGSASRSGVTGPRFSRPWPFVWCRDVVTARRREWFPAKRQRNVGSNHGSLTQQPVAGMLHVRCQK